MLTLFAYSEEFILKKGEDNVFSNQFSDLWASRDFSLVFLTLCLKQEHICFSCLGERGDAVKL